MEHTPKLLLKVDCTPDSIIMIMRATGFQIAYFTLENRMEMFI